MVAKTNLEKPLLVRESERLTVSLIRVNFNPNVSVRVSERVSEWVSEWVGE